MCGNYAKNCGVEKGWRGRNCCWYSCQVRKSATLDSNTRPPQCRKKTAKAGLEESKQTRIDPTRTKLSQNGTKLTKMNQINLNCSFKKITRNYVRKNEGLNCVAFSRGLGTMLLHFQYPLPRCTIFKAQN